jgi:hypothetical protein
MSHMRAAILRHGSGNSRSNPSGGHAALSAFLLNGSVPVTTNDKPRAARVMHPLYIACLAHNLGITPQTWVRRHLPEGTRIDGLVVPPESLAQFLLPYLMDTSDMPAADCQGSESLPSTPDPRRDIAARQVVAAAEALSDAWESRDLVQGTRHLEALVHAVGTLRRIDGRPRRHDA